MTGRLWVFVLSIQKKRPAACCLKGKSLQILVGSFTRIWTLKTNHWPFGGVQFQQQQQQQQKQNTSTTCPFSSESKGPPPPNFPTFFARTEGLNTSTRKVFHVEPKNSPIKNKENYLRKNLHLRPQKCEFSQGVSLLGLSIIVPLGCPRKLGSVVRISGLFHPKEYPIY